MSNRNSIQIRPFADAPRRGRSVATVAAAVALLGSLAMAIGSGPARAQPGSAGEDRAAAASGGSGKPAAGAAAGPAAVVRSARRSSRSLIAPPRICPDADSPAKRSRALDTMACLTNYARRRSGLPKYRVEAGLVRAADRKAADILRCGAFSHTACGRPFDWWIKRKYASRRCYWAGENIAWGSRTVGGARDIFRAWMQSRGHRAAILSRRYTDLGIGFRGGSLRGRPQARVWVQHFGRLC